MFNEATSDWYQKILAAQLSGVGYVNTEPHAEHMKGVE